MLSTSNSSSSSSPSFHFHRPAVRTTSRRPSAFRPISATAPPPTLTATSSSSASLYDVLGLPSAASREEIKTAYRRLARSCHPDVSGDRSADQFLRVRDAYVTLSDPHSRADYDRRSSPAAPLRRTASTPNRPRRTWETDQCW